MDANTQPTPDPAIAAARAAAKKKLDALVAEYQTILDPQERNQFFYDNPELRAVYSEANHH